MIHRTRPAMGTLFEVLLRGEDEEHLSAVAEAILDEIQRIDRLLSRFNPRSEISRLNRLAATEPVLIDYELAALLQSCFDANDWTHGAFDIAAQCRRGTSPAGRLHKRASLPIQFDVRNRTIQFNAADLQLDLGGIGKGYALDRAAELLAEHRIDHVLLHGGTSSVLARGCDASGHPWRVALRHPVTGQDAQTVELNDAALSCSATNEQHDIINPQTGQPPAESAACTVIAKSAREAEILSTALVCLGRESGEQLVEQYAPGKVQCIWIE